MPEVDFSSSHAFDVRGSVSVGGGHLKADTIRFRTDQGPFEATLDIDLARLPLAYALTLHGDPLDVATIMGAPGFGMGALKLDARGVGPDADGLQGSGELKVAAGTLPASPTLRAIEQALGRTHIVGAAYQPIAAPFRIERGRVILDATEVRTDQVGIAMSGWASLAGPVEHIGSTSVPGLAAKPIIRRRRGQRPRPAHRRAGPRGGAAEGHRHAAGAARRRGHGRAGRPGGAGRGAEAAGEGGPGPGRPLQEEAARPLRRASS